ncbi:MAG: hypothetical protein V1794_06890 [Candidatus Glassbacteria bacterium]
MAAKKYGKTPNRQNKLHVRSPRPGSGPKNKGRAHDQGKSNRIPR